MHAKATAKAEEKDIRSQSKVHCLFSCHCVSAPHLHREPLLNNGIAGSERAHRRETRAGEGECKVHQAAAQTDRKCSANVGRIFLLPNARPGWNLIAYSQQIDFGQLFFAEKLASETANLLLLGSSLPADS